MRLGSVCFFPISCFALLCLLACDEQVRHGAANRHWSWSWSGLGRYYKKWAYPAAVGVCYCLLRVRMLGFGGGGFTVDCRASFSTSWVGLGNCVQLCLCCMHLSSLHRAEQKRVNGPVSYGSCEMERIFAGM